MKKFIALIVLLAGVTAVMVYLYFSRLNRENDDNSLPLLAVAKTSGLVFRFQHDRSFYDIMKGQALFNELLGPRKTAELQAIYTHLLSDPAIGQAIQGQKIYAGVVPGAEKELDLLFTTRIGPDVSTEAVQALLRQRFKARLNQDIFELSPADSIRFYLSIKQNLLVFSSNRAAVQQAAAPAGNTSDFAAYISETARFNRNTLANLFIDFSKVPLLLQQMVAGSLNGELAVLDKQAAFAALNYNFSNQRLAFHGSTTLAAQPGFLQLFTAAAPQKMTIVNILPSQTANYTLYIVPEYQAWRKSFEQLLEQRKELAPAQKARQTVQEKYRIDPEKTFPAFFKQQMISFQLSTGEKLAAIDLRNGEKLSQLLIEMSDDYAQDIQVLKDPGLLYSYFGDPFKRFERPFFTIVNNYFVCANTASTVQSFLNSYRNDRLLHVTDNYTRLFGQLPNTASVVFYVNQNNSTDIFRQNLHLPYYRQLRSDDGLKNYSAFCYLLSGDKGKFQTNIILDKKTAAADSLAAN